MIMGSYSKKTRTETEKSIETFLITASLGQTRSLIERKIIAFKQAITSTKLVQKPYVPDPNDNKQVVSGANATPLAIKCWK